MRAHNRREHGHWLVLILSLLLTGAATAFTAWGAHERDRVRFRNAVQSAHDRIVSRLDIYITTLRGAASLFASSDTVTEEEFRRYAEQLDMVRRYPGIEGLGWTRRLEAGLPAADPERHAIRYFEPLGARNRGAIGLDMGRDPVRRQAMVRARDTGEPSLTGRVRLLQSIHGPGQSGFLLFVPVYEGGVVPRTVAERRASLLGFVYSPFRSGNLFRDIFGTERQPRVSFDVFDGAAADSAALLYESPHTVRHRPDVTAVDRLDVAGRSWTVTYASEPAFDDASSGYLVPAVLVFGLLVSTWITWLALAQGNAMLAAEAANRAKSDFLATMSHELRTPLNAIGGYVDLLELGIAGPINEQQRKYLGRIQHAQQLLLGLINSILNFARLEGGGISYRRDLVAITDLVDEAAAFVTPLVSAKGLRFAVEPGPPVAVLADTDKLRQVLLNLLSNAIKFTDAGGRVTVSWEVRSRFALVHVQDTGIGIAAEQQEQIFDPFVQVDPDLTRTRAGSGLGLAISRELARGMSGELFVRSTPGAGSVFTLQLPLPESEVRDLAAADARAAS